MILHLVLEVDILPVRGKFHIFVKFFYEVSILLLVQEDQMILIALKCKLERLEQPGAVRLLFHQGWELLRNVERSLHV